MLGRSGGGSNGRVSSTELFVNDDGVLALVDVDIPPMAKLRGMAMTLGSFERTAAQVTQVREHWFDASGFDELKSWKTRQG